jgi:hypothetical protein
MVNLRISSLIQIANSTHGNNPSTLPFFHAHQKASSFSEKEGAVALFGIATLTFPPPHKRSTNVASSTPSEKNKIPVKTRLFTN